MWKKKGATPQGDTLQKIADYFGVTVDYLLTGEQSVLSDTPPGTIKNAPTDLGVDDKGYGLLAAYSENKDYLDESDAEDIELFIRMKAERKRAKDDAARKDTE